MSSTAGAKREEEDAIENLWTESLSQIIAIDPVIENWKSQVLPLARIKKIMKSEEVLYVEEEKEKDDSTEIEAPSHRFMIKGEASLLMGKACELLIRELTMRSWRHTEKNRRKTLQRQDVQAAVWEDEVYDYLIDIIPRIQPGSTSEVSVDEPLSPKLPSFAASPTAPSFNLALTNRSVQPTDTEMSINDAKLRLEHLQQMQVMIIQHIQGTGLHQTHALNNTLAQISVNANPAFYPQPTWNTAHALRSLQDAASLEQKQNKEKPAK